MPVIIIWKRMGWLVPVLGLLGPLLAEAAMEAFWGYEVRLIDQCLAAAVGSLLIYYTGTWLNAPERLAVRDEETNEVIKQKSEHTFFGIPFQWWAFIFPAYYFWAYCL